MYGFFIGLIAIIIIFLSTASHTCIPTYDVNEETKTVVMDICDLAIEGYVDNVVIYEDGEILLRRNIGE